jgi:hypothetical protein
MDLGLSSGGSVKNIPTRLVFYAICISAHSVRSARVPLLEATTYEQTRVGSVNDLASQVQILALLRAEGRYDAGEVKSSADLFFKGQRA